MKAIERGDALPSRTWEVKPDGKGGFTRAQVDPKSVKRGKKSPLAGNEAIIARQKLGLSQNTFAALLGISDGTLKGWEQGRRQPTGAARVLLRVAATHPEAVLEAAKG